MRLVPLVFLSLAHAGSYGGVSHAFAGYSTNIDCSVGSWSDHAAEGRAFDTCKQRAEAELAGRDPEIAALYRHFLAHARAQLAALLDRAAQKGDWEHSVRVELPHSDPATRNIVLQLFVKNQASEAQRYKLAAELARTQLLQGGLFAKDLPRSDRDLAETQQLLVGVTARDPPLHLLQLALERREDVAQLARALQPVPKKYQWAGDQRPALVAARIVEAVLKSRPFPDDTFALAAQLDAEPRAQLALLMAVFSGDERVKKLSDDPLIAELLKL
jgi:hypothetical protein